MISLVGLKKWEEEVQSHTELDKSARAKLMLSREDSSWTADNWLEMLVTKAMHLTSIFSYS